GLRAYSLYLWHVPIMWLVWISVPGDNRPMKGLIALSLIALVVPLSFWLFEKPVLRDSPRLDKAERAGSPSRPHASP
ncbi:MAG: hypothetical protein ACTHJJ_13330, partial [Intrasporangium sp.]